MTDTDDSCQVCGAPAGEPHGESQDPETGKWSITCDDDQPLVLAEALELWMVGWWVGAQLPGPPPMPELKLLAQSTAEMLAREGWLKGHSPM